MKKIILGLLISNILSFAGLFGDTDEEREIAKKRMTNMVIFGGNKEVLEIKKENYKIKKTLKKHHINYEHTLKIMRNKEKIQEIKNSFIITEKKEIEILKKENKELKRLLKVNYISTKETVNKKEKKSRLNIEVKEKKNINDEMEKAIEAVN